MLEALFAKHRKIILSVAILLTVLGLLQFNSMPRQEDPFFPYRAGLITAPLPGATVKEVEQRILEPLELELAKVEYVDRTESMALNGLALVTVWLNDEIYETEKAWTRVRDAISRAHTKFPSGVQKPSLDDRRVATPIATIALSSSENVWRLEEKALELQDRLLENDAVMQTQLMGQPQREYLIALKGGALQKAGVSAREVLAQVKQYVNVQAAGFLTDDERQLSVSVRGAANNLQSLRDVVIQTPTQALSLSAVADVQLSTMTPFNDKMVIDGEESILIEVTALPNVLNVVSFGTQLRELVKSFDEAEQQINAKLIFFQPDNVEKRLSDLSTSLLVGVAIIALTLMLVMGWRVGLVVSSILPMVVATALVIWAGTGGVLHQMTVIGMVVALGILIDNAIVVTESIQHYIDEGRTNLDAAVTSVKELRMPLAAATGTSVAAFLPLMLFKGPTADLTGAVPRMIALCLVVSYFFALLVTPTLAAIFLRKRSDTQDSQNQYFVRLARFVIEKRWVILFSTIGLIGLSAVGFMKLDKQFFPFADRAIVVVDIELEAGSSIYRTDELSNKLSTRIKADIPGLSVYRFVGSTGPKFYYNLPSRPSEVNRARLVLHTGNFENNPSVIETARSIANTVLPESAKISVFQLRQGPPVKAPVEIRIMSTEPADVAHVSEKVYEVVSNINGTRDVSMSLSPYLPSIVLQPKFNRLQEHQISIRELNELSLIATEGVLAGEVYRSGSNIPVRLGTFEQNHIEASDLGAYELRSNDGELVSLQELVSINYEMSPSRIEHYNQQVLVTISSELADGFYFDDVFNAIEGELNEMTLPVGIEIDFGGEKEASGKANTALTKAAPVGVVLLFLCLLTQFGSYRRMFIILLTIPLVPIGIVPGLLLSGSAFGFQPLQGVIALTGIVVNTAIVLLAVFDEKLESGYAPKRAIVEAVSRRSKPILLTMGTTILGLLPLALSESTLWPPMAWAMISGLLASTALSLCLLPGVIYWLFKNRA